MEEGPSYWERQKGQMQCREHGEEMAARSIVGHMKTQHERAAEDIWSLTTSATREELQTYRTAFPAKGDPQICPVEG